MSSRTIQEYRSEKSGERKRETTARRFRSSLLALWACGVVAAAVLVAGGYEVHVLVSRSKSRSTSKDESLTQGFGAIAESERLEITREAREAVDNELKDIQNVKERETAIEYDQKAIKIMLLEAIDPRHSMTVDAISDREYRRLKTAAVDLLVKTDGVSKIDGGYRLRILVGNPSAIQLGGMLIHLEWGKPYPDDGNADQIMDWFKHLRKKDVTLTDLFPSGKWTSIALDLIPADESELHAVTLQFKPLTLELN
jgi:hypothetical protein